MFWAAGAVGDEEEALRDFQGAVDSSDGGQLILVLHRCLLETLNTKNTEWYSFSHKVKCTSTSDCEEMDGRRHLPACSLHCHRGEPGQTLASGKEAPGGQALDGLGAPQLTQSFSQQSQGNLQLQTLSGKSRVSFSHKKNPYC